MAMRETSQSDLLAVTIEDVGVLHAAYMPFIADGGLFIPTAKRYRLGEEVFVLLGLLDDAANIPLAGEVVWIAPQGALGGTAGIGVRFNDRDDAVRRRIEAQLDGLADFDGRETYTM